MNLDPLAETITKISPYTYGLNNPIYYRDYDGRSAKGLFNPYIIFDGSKNKIYIWDDNNTPNDPTDDVLLGEFDAHNMVVSTSNGKWEDGIYGMLDKHSPHKHPNSNQIEPSIPAIADKNGNRSYMSVDTQNGAYGTRGIYRALPFKQANGKTRRGMGFHAGREYKSFLSRQTRGCIRCEPDFFPAMEDAIKKFGSWNESIIINNTSTRGSLTPLDPITPAPITPLPVTPPLVDPPVIPPVNPAPLPDNPPPLIIPPRPPDSGF